MPWTEILWVASGATCVVTLLSLAATVRHGTKLHPFLGRMPGQVTLILPVTGSLPGVEALFKALAVQAFPARRLIIAVEALDDLAVARVRGAAHLLACPMQIVVGGRCDTRGQKCTNLIAALREIDAEDDAILLFDADIIPQAWWLGTMVQPLFAGHADLVTGYRWPLLNRSAPMVQILAWLDRAIATLPKFRRFGMVWGGSIAMSRAALARLDLPQVLDRTLSDDLSIGAAARRCGLNVLTRDVLLLPTPMEGSVTEFMRRQFKIGHLYRTALFRATAAMHASEALGWIALFVLATQSRLAVATIGGLLVLRLVRWHLYQRAGRRIGAPDALFDRLCQALVALTPPVGSLAVLVLIVQSWPRRELTWRHITYIIDAPDRLRVLRRAPPGPSRP